LKRWGLRLQDKRRGKSNVAEDGPSSFDVSARAVRKNSSTSESGSELLDERGLRKRVAKVFAFG